MEIDNSITISDSKCIIAYDGFYTAKSDGAFTVSGMVACYNDGHPLYIGYPFYSYLSVFTNCVNNDYCGSSVAMWLTVFNDDIEVEIPIYYSIDSHKLASISDLILPGFFVDPLLKAANLAIEYVINSSAEEEIILDIVCIVP